MSPEGPAAHRKSIKKIWLDAYPEGVPAEVDVHAYSSVVDVLEKSIEHFRDRPAFANMGTVLRYGDLDRHTRNFAAYLLQDLGLQKGARVAIMMPNLLQYPIALFGVLRAGLVVTNVNPLYTPRELRHQLVDSGAHVIVILENFCHILEQVLPETQVRVVIRTRIGDMLRFPKSLLANVVVKHIKKMVPPYNIPDAVDFRQALNMGAEEELPLVILDQENIAFLQYTAGTTGVSKGVILTHGNIVANLQQASAWIGPCIEEGKEIIVTPLPLYHIFSLTGNCLLYMKIGGLIYLITNPRDFKGFVHEISKLRFTAITGVNTLFNALLNTPGFSDIDFSALKISLGGGMAVQRGVAERWKQVTGTTLVEAYGLTEASPGVCINPVDLKDYNGKIGLPMPSTECSIQDDAGNLLPPGEMGELCVRGPQVMRGYWNRADQTGKVLSADGWLRSGDLGFMDERGFFQILERKDDMIVVSGFNVYPSEVESVVAKHPGVLEVAAIGVPDESRGQVIKLFVVKQLPALTKEVLLDYCRNHLTGYKVPRQIEFRESLPKSNVGKILRRVLR